MPAGPDKRIAATRPFIATGAALVLRVLSLGVLTLGTVQARAAEADRHLLTGSLDSRVNLWEERRRIPLPGVIVSSETYMVIRGIPDPHEADGSREVVEIFNVHRTEPTGDLSPERRQAMARVALEGVIRSYDSGLQTILSSAGLPGAESASDAAFIQPTETGGFIVVEPVIQRRVPSGETISHASGSALSDAELLRRFDLGGVISSEDRQIERVLLTDGHASPAASGSMPAAGSSERGTFDRARVAAAMLPSVFLNNLTHPDLSTFLRHDSVDYDDGDSSSTTLAFVGARFDLELGQPRWSLNGAYNLEAAEYLDGSLDGYINHTLSADYLYRLTRKDSLHTSAYLRDWHDTRDQRAIDDFQGTAAGSYQNRSTGMQVGWERGTERARLHYGVTASADNARIEFDQAAGYEQHSRTLSATGAYRLRRRVSVLLDGQIRKFDYSDQFADSSQARIRGGLGFDFSRRLSGRAVAGYERKRLDGRGDSDGAFVFDADVTWQPRRRSTLSLEAASEFVEVFERPEAEEIPDAYGLQLLGRVAWRQDWTSRWNSQASLAYRDLEFRNSDSGSEDWQFVAAGNYQMSPELTVSAESAYTRSEDVARGDYERWTFTLRLNLVRR